MNTKDFKGTKIMHRKKRKRFTRAKFYKQNKHLIVDNNHDLYFTKMENEFPSEYRQILIDTDSLCGTDVFSFDKVIELIQGK